MDDIGFFSDPKYKLFVSQIERDAAEAAAGVTPGGVWARREAGTTAEAGYVNLAGTWVSTTGGGGGGGGGQVQIDTATARYILSPFATKAPFASFAVTTDQVAIDTATSAYTLVP